MKMNSMALLTLSSTVTAAVMVYKTIKKSSTTWLEWKIMDTEFNSMNLAILLDWKAMVFVWTVMLISSSIIIYSKFYMPSQTKTTFTKLIMAFVASMVLLILSPNLITMVMGWESLGMSSFILIMFFMNKTSLMSSMYTMMVNRLGDITLMIGIMLVMNVNSWSFTSAMMKSSLVAALTFVSISLFSKSAQIPFSSWLTEAMAAPTPVSALVHSSTLVTAGIYIMIRMELSMKIMNMNKLVFTIAVMTLVMASMNAIMELDIKKLVALSTLSQLSTMFMAISINMYKMALFHMLMHATFKALIFICSSSMISMSNTQDLRKMSSSTKTSATTSTMINIASLTLCGLMFSSAFYSKELIMEMMLIKNTNYICTVMFMMCMGVTMFYSLKMIMITSIFKTWITVKMVNEDMNQKTSKLLIMIPSTISGNKMNWLININSDIPYMNFTEKAMPLMAMTITTLAMINMFYTKNLNRNSMNKMAINLMWFMKNASIYYKFYVFNMMFLTQKITEKGNLNNIVTKIKTITMENQVKKLIFNQSSFKNTMTISIMVILALI
uniref:NADH:ubiquinone reductase (H(+)-translocating) n=1 Tax=Aleurocanthus spiniferus TaxID=593793 RepID=A0A0X8R480_ALESP|nr:NADH dehydrogenase subunit 5 [Aleurocanthus spiniferus]AHY04219.1 NADH dehydrogenase subunit 5 [Aleurocanthus spiniferus]